MSWAGRQWRRLSTLRVLARHPGIIAAYARARITGSYPEARYDGLWQEVRRIRPACIVEIGVFQGDTGRRLIREALRFRPSIQYWGFDLFEENMTAATAEAEASLLTMPLSLADTARRLEHPGATVRLVAGDTRETLRDAPVQPPADLVFLDGGHSYETVTSDWNNVQRFLHRDSVVLFDDYSDEEAERHEHFGVKRAVDEIDRAVWNVQLLHGVDRYVRPWGVLDSRLARVTRR